MSRLPAEPRDQWTPIHERVSEKLGGHFKTQPLKLALMGQCPRGSRLRFAERLPSSRAEDWRLHARAGYSQRTCFRSEVLWT